MAKAKSPKKTNGKETVNPTSIVLPVSDTSVTPAEAMAAAAPAPQAGTNGSKKTGTKKAAPKPELVRNDSRATVVPISVTPVNLDEEIRRFAYLLSERRGFEPGHEAEDWLAAENEVRQRYHQHGA